MLFNEDISNARCRITHYDDKSITVSGEVYSHSAIVFPGKIITDWPPQALQDVSEAHLEPIIHAQPEILLIGTGKYSMRLSPQLRIFLESHNIGVECMTTPAACRSYMALLSEGRNMAAIIFPGS
jgi:uncharacterized protein